MLDQCTHSRHLAVVPLSLLVLVLASAQVRSEPTRRLITQAIDESKQVELPGNTRPEANIDNDRGMVPDSLPMEHMRLQLRLPMEKEEELDNLLQKIQDPNSPDYHKWLTPEEFKKQFSLAPEDIETIANWLKSQGFTVNVVNARSVDFSGTAGQVRYAFRTEIHYFDVRGVRHIANLSNPQIPAALAPAVAGIVSLNDFKPRPINGVQ
jgi:pro-kumamolisin-like protein